VPVNQYSAMPLSIRSRSTLSSGSPSAGSVSSLNFSTIQANWPTGESCRPYATVCGRLELHCR
jgi:hypothetical protein